MCSVQFYVTSAGQQYNCCTAHDSRYWSVKQNTPGKSDYAVMWHHVSYLRVPDGAYVGDANLRSDLPKMRWKVHYQLRCQKLPQPNKVNVVSMKLVFKTATLGRSCLLSVVPSNYAIVHKLQSACDYNFVVLVSHPLLYHLVFLWSHFQAL